MENQHPDQHKKILDKITDNMQKHFLIHIVEWKFFYLL